MSKFELQKIRDQLKSCYNQKNEGCQKLISYRERCNVIGAQHPLLFQIVKNPRIIIIGAVPGSIDAQGKSNYQSLVNGQFSLGHKSAQGLGEIMGRVSQLKDIDFSPGIFEIPTTLRFQNSHLKARERLGLHVTNLVKCNAPTGWEKESHALWVEAATACEKLHLKFEIDTVNPELVIFLGDKVASYFSKKEGWDREKMKITAWINEADYLPFFGRDRFITAWPHTGGRYFWIQGRKYWDLYAKQMARFI